MEILTAPLHLSTLICKGFTVQGVNSEYVGNLAFSTTDHDLRQLFEPYGVVDEIRVITDRDTGRSKGFGFVEMPDRTAAKTAMAKLQGQEMEGRTLTVNEAKPREPRREASRSRW